MDAGPAVDVAVHTIQVAVRVGEDIGLVVKIAADPAAEPAADLVVEPAAGLSPRAERGTDGEIAFDAESVVVAVLAWGVALVLKLASLASLAELDLVVKLALASGLVRPLALS